MISTWHDSYDYEDLNGNLKTRYFYDYPDYNALGFICTPDALYYDCNLRFFSNVETDNFSFVVEVASDVDSIEEYLSSNSSDSGGSSAPDDSISSFFSVIETAFNFCISCLKDMINTVTENSVLCLGIAMWCIGGAIGLYKRLV